MTGWGGRIERAVEGTARAGSLVAGLAVLVITVLITYSVILRYFFGRPQIFVDELATFLLVVVICWGLAHTFRSDGHITVDLLVRRLGPRARAGLRAATLLLGAAFVAVVTWQTLDTTLRAYRYGRVSTVMLYPLWVPHLAIPLGFALLLAAMLLALVRSARRRGSVGSPPGSPD